MTSDFLHSAFHDSHVFFPKTEVATFESVVPCFPPCCFKNKPPFLTLKKTPRTSLTNQEYVEASEELGSDSVFMCFFST